MKPVTAISCSRQARIIFSLWPFFLASPALCRRWLSEAKRFLKKSIRAGFFGIAGRRGSAPIRKNVSGFHLLTPFGARLCGGLDCVDYSLISGAATVIAGDMVADRIPARHPAMEIALGKQRLRSNQHPRGTKATLQRVSPRKSILKIGNRAGIRQSLDGLHLRPVALDREHQAAADHPGIEQHRAGAAYPLLAADMAAGQAQLLAQGS